MSTAAGKSRGAKAKSWWARRRNRSKIWLGVAGAGLMAIVAGWFWLSNQDTGVMSEGNAPVGAPVQAVQLEDSRTGEMFDLSQYLGKKDIVVVAYMGDFCLGCAELVAELERRVPDFDAADAYVVGLGSEVGSVGRETVQKRGIESYPLLQEGPPHTFTKRIGMWSEHMPMPFMGYVIIGKDGTILAGEQTSLSEAKGAAPANVNQLLAALREARSASAAADTASAALATTGQ